MACESDAKTGAIAKRIVPMIEFTTHDLRELRKENINSEFDLLLSATPCKGFSGINDRAEGLDGEDGELMRAAAEIVKKAKEINPKAKTLIENVKVNTQIEHQIEEIDGLFDSPSQG